MFCRNRSGAVVATAALAVLGLGFTASRAATAPKAVYAAAQATAGSKAYETNCSGCHGAQLEGGAGPALAGPNFKTLSTHTKLTVSDLFTFFSQQMPLNAPGSLTHDQYTSIMAFLLKSNGYPSGSAKLTYGGAMKLKMPITSLKGG